MLATLVVLVLSVMSLCLSFAHDLVAAASQVTLWVTAMVLLQKRQVSCFAAPRCCYREWWRRLPAGYRRLQHGGDAEGPANVDVDLDALEGQSHSPSVDNSNNDHKEPTMCASGGGGGGGVLPVSVSGGGGGVPPVSASDGGGGVPPVSASDGGGGVSAVAARRARMDAEFASLLRDLAAAENAAS